MEKSEAKNMGDFGPMTAAKILWKAMPKMKSVSKAAVLKRNNAASQLKKQFWRGNRSTTLTTERPREQ